MKLCDLKPNPSLRQYISRYWVWENEQDFPPILPGTGTELMFHYNDPFVAQNQNEKIFTAPSCHIISPRCGFISVRFRAGAFRHFCGESTSDLIDSFIDINDLWGKQGKEFGQQVLMAKSLKERIIIIESFLIKLLERYHHPKSWLDTAVKNVFNGYDIAKLKEVTNDLFICDRQLQRKFKEAVGVSPKTFQRISRFETVLKYLMLNRKKDYLEVALKHGYYDQPHFIKEFKTHVGESPSIFLQNKNFMSHFYNEKLKN
ncbi:MAG: AraC family transcriptional regulator [Firmicutes bacterium]|nr:AraC family transcriptional regulator [Bacillota bacterium]